MPGDKPLGFWLLPENKKSIFSIYISYRYLLKAIDKTERLGLLYR